MNRLIDADELKELIAANVYPVCDDLNSRDYGMFWTGGIEKAIDEATTVVEIKYPITRVMVRGVEYVPVVRCKDCVHYESMICGITDMVGDDDDYCSYGVRKTEPQQVTSKLGSVENTTVSACESTMSQPNGKLKDEPQQKSCATCKHALGDWDGESDCCGRCCGADRRFYEPIEDEPQTERSE